MGRSSKSTLPIPLSEEWRQMSNNPYSTKNLQAADPRLTWTDEMGNQAMQTAKGKMPPNPNFSGQQIGQALQQQALQQEATKNVVAPQQQAGWNKLV